MPVGAEGCAVADYLFIPQSVLDKWSDHGRVELKGRVLTLSREKKSFQLTSAVRFLKMEAGDDSAGLLGKVKTLDALKQMGAEQYMESVLLGEAAYKVQQGFLAEANALRRAVGVKAPARPQAASGRGAAEKQKSAEAGEQDLLAQFLLENLQ
jgi:hypothetical protein